MTEQQLREMQIEDLPAVMKNERQGYTHPWNEGIFRSCLTSGHECWLLLDAEKIIGHSVMTIAAGECHLLNVCIHPDSQGKGHGRLLVEHALACAKAEDAAIVFLEVRASNPRAYKLYEKLGFNEIGTRPNYYPTKKGREDALVLAKELLN